MEFECVSVGRGYIRAGHYRQLSVSILPLSRCNCPVWWCSAQRIKIAMIAGGNHTIISVSTPYGFWERIAPQGHFLAALRAPHQSADWFAMTFVDRYSPMFVPIRRAGDSDRSREPDGVMLPPAKQDVTGRRPMPTNYNLSGGFLPLTDVWGSGYTGFMRRGSFGKVCDPGGKLRGEI